MNIAEYQNLIIKQVLLIRDKEQLDELSRHISELKKTKPEQEEKDMSEFDNYQEWVRYLGQTDPRTPDSFLPEWGMTLDDFRRFLWDAEHGGITPADDFLDKIS